MDWINKLEKKFRRFSIENLMLYIVIGNLIVYLVEYLNLMPFLTSYLYFTPDTFLSGQIWRIITFVFIPPRSSVIFIIFVLYFYYIIGNSLENQWGTARFNIYYFLGVLGAIVGSFLTSSPATSTYLNLSLFLAFAQLYPEHQVYIFGILPIKMKYLAYLNWFFFISTIIFDSWSSKIFAILSLINFFLFFYKDFIKDIKLKIQVYKNRKRFQGQIREFKRKKGD